MNSGRQSRDPAVNRQEELAQDLDARVERLQEWVCVLLLKNQMLRMALQAERANDQRSYSSYPPAVPQKDAMGNMISQSKFDFVN
jgi:hypothetical protein